MSRGAIDGHCRSHTHPIWVDVVWSLCACYVQDYRVVLKRLHHNCASFKQAVDHLAAQRQVHTHPANSPPDDTNLPLTASLSVCLSVNVPAARDGPCADGAGSHPHHDAPPNTPTRRHHTQEAFHTAGKGRGSSSGLPPSPHCRRSSVLARCRPPSAEAASDASDDQAPLPHAAAAAAG